MKTLIYFLFSSTEWLALIVLTFAMFKLQFKGYWGQIILTAVAMSFLSHFLFIVIDKRVIATVLQPPALFLFLWQVFRIQVFYAALITVYGYLGYLFIQYAVMLLQLGIGVSLESLVPGSGIMYVLQGISICIVLLIAWLLIKFRVGYTFVPDYEHTPFTLKGINLRLLLLILAGYCAIASSNYIAFTISIPTLLALLSYFILGVLLYYAQRKEYTND